MCNAVTSLAVDGCTQFLATHAVRKPPALGTVSRAARHLHALRHRSGVPGRRGFRPHQMAVQAPPGFSRESNPQRHVVNTVLNHEQNWNKPSCQPVQLRHTANPRTDLACCTGPLSCGTCERLNCILTGDLLQSACQLGTVAGRR